jgi:hypothetical protein
MRVSLNLSLRLARPFCPPPRIFRFPYPATLPKICKKYGFGLENGFVNIKHEENLL